MKRGSAHSYVVRDTGLSIVFWLVAGVGALLTIDAVAHGQLGQIAATASIAGLVVWGAGMVLFHPHIRYDAAGVVVTNIGRVHEIPWSRVVAVRQNLNLTFELDDGRRIAAAGVTAPRDRGLIAGTLTRGKLGAGSADFHRYSDAVRLLQTEAAPSDSPAVSRWDAPALLIGAALALVVVTVVVVGAL